ncbi:MAG: Extracellular solute-binding protein, family 1 [uncultured bacterium]|nr:MAG: Extracellular solute-binding protein, family 1 [uncultured bacterium]KKU26088.1 MAG: Extracellular solute-binding protein family 1 [Microgenomates group bacterium GW2011_GWA2_46_16]
MSKFPDPTKEYAGAPVTGAIDLSRSIAETPNEAVGEVGQPVPLANEPPPLYTAPPSPTSPTESSIPAPSVVPSKRNVVGSHLIPIAIGILALVLLLVFGFSVLPKLFKKSAPITLNYWGLWEPTSVIQSVIAEYEASHPNIKINYTLQSSKNYRSRMLATTGQASAPDIIRIHNTWLPMLRKNLSPAPDTLLKVSDLADYYPVVQKDFVLGNKIYALPLEIDGLALIYNVDIFDAEGLSPPSDWNSLRKIAFDLTKTNAETGIIERAGVALGTTNNVDNWSDILGLLILQNSGNPGRPSEVAVQEALTFYTTISLKDKSWDASQPSSVYAFATGTVAMIFAPAWQVAEIKVINPELNFAIAPVPVLPTSNVAWASYWGEAVPATSKHPAEAWEFIKYLGSSVALQQMYAGASQIRPIGEPYPLISLSSTLASDPLAGAYVSQGPKYSSWYLASRTYDEGINDQLIKYYEDAINSINGGSSVGAILKTLEAGVAQVLAKYPEAK